MLTVNSNHVQSLENVFSAARKCCLRLGTPRQELLVYAAAREICAQSLALQVRIGLVALVYLGSSTFPLQVGCRSSGSVFFSHSFRG